MGDYQTANTLRLAQKTIADLTAKNQCDACAGTGEPISGGKCMCGGSGLMSDAAIYLRSRVTELEFVGRLPADFRRAVAVMLRLLCVMFCTKTGRDPRGVFRLPRAVRSHAHFPDTMVHPHEPAVLEIQVCVTHNDVDSQSRDESKLGTAFVFVAISMSGRMRRRM